MMREKTRRLEQFVALVVALCISLSGVTQVLAAPAHGSGKFEADRLTPLPSRPAAAVDAVYVTDLRGKVARLNESADPRLKKEGARLGRWADILGAATPAERHAAVQRLPVTVTKARATDGRKGTLKQFAAGGKVRVEVFEPDPAFGADDGAGGPSAGDPTEPEECYYEGQPDTCVTQQELDDLSMQVAVAQYEVEVMQSDFDASYAEYQAYCSQYPWECGDEAMRMPGPNVGAGCASQAVNAITTIAGAAGTAYLAGEAIATGAIATAGAAIATGAVVGAAVVGAAWFGYEWYKCMWPRITEALGLLQPFEVVGY